MSWKAFALAVLSLATVTACAHPAETGFETRTASRVQGLEYSGKISAGACDDLGQLIPSNSMPLTAEASAAPTR